MCEGALPEEPSFKDLGCVFCSDEDNDGPPQCVGSLTMTHMDEYMKIQDLTLEGSRESYPNLRRRFPFMRQNTVILLEVIGNCCWELNEKRNFRGEKQLIYPGGNLIYPDFQPVSIKKLVC